MVLPQFPGNHFDACVTDPPYELGFMGKAWDKSGIAYNVDVWREVLRILKPGAHLLSFGGTRTYHRMACAIEDAGFEIRDQIQWIYGSGFPKSLDISKAIDKAAGVERTEVIGTKDCGYQVAISRIRKEQGYRPNLTNATREVDITVPATPEAQQWDGWGTALKPANEPVVLARKPIEGTVAANVLKWGTGGLHIDGGRIPLNGEQPPTGSGKPVKGNADIMSRALGNNGNITPAEGRFPANIILDEVAAALLNEQSGESVSRSGGRSGKNANPMSWEEDNQNRPRIGHNDTGGASRFFYCAKASQAERKESKHPTVKPLDLMKYLCRLVTPPGGLILDPFAGSGTTIQAAVEEGFRAVGIELRAEHCEDIRRRMDNMQLNIFSIGWVRE